MQHKKGITKERVYVKKDHQESRRATERERENYTHTQDHPHPSHYAVYPPYPTLFPLLRFFPTCPFFPFSHVSFRNICV